MDTWYQSGTEVVFACGGGIYTSVVDAAKKVGGKVIGVDVDQSANIAEYAGEDGLTLTSAMKGLYPTTYDTLTDVVLNGNWDNYKGEIATLGLISGDDPTANYVQIPMDTTQWGDGFTQDDYKAMVKDMYDGKITVDNDTSKAPVPSRSNDMISVPGCSSTYPVSVSFKDSSAVFLPVSSSLPFSETVLS